MVPNNLPRVGQWLSQILTDRRMSNADLARLLGVSRAEVQRWSDGDKVVPRHHLAEAALHMGTHGDLAFALQLKTCEELTDRLRTQVEGLARRIECRPEPLTAAVLSLAWALAREKSGRGSAQLADRYLRRLSDARFVLRTLAEAARKADGSRVLSSHTIYRHLRHPANHFLGLVLDLAVQTPGVFDNGLPGFRAELLRGLRRLALTAPHSGPSALVNHHAIHLLGRHGDADDRGLVRDLIGTACTADDPFSVRLGYTGLIAGTKDPDMVQRYIAQLRRDYFLAQSDLAFEALHYGDLVLRFPDTLPSAFDGRERLMSSLLDRLEQPDTFGYQDELDCMRLLVLLDRKGGSLTHQRATLKRLARVLLPSSQAAGFYRQRLERRVLALAGSGAVDMAQPVGNATELRSDSQAYDAFVGYSSVDRDLVLRIVRLLEARGIRTWVDEFNLPPGRLFQDEIELALESSRAALLFVGPDGVGPWERIEIRAAISQHIQRGLVVIPVVLDPLAPTSLLPMFLREFRMVRIDPHDGMSRGVDELVWGITGSSGWT